MNHMMTKRTLNFPAGVFTDGTARSRIITFTNDGEFTTNSETYHKVPQNEETFNTCIDTYIRTGEATEIIPSL